MNCSNVQNAISAYIDRELTGEQMLSIRSHLNCCPRCAQEHQALSVLKAELVQLPSFEPSAQLEREILQAINREDSEARPVRLSFRSWGALVATSAAAAALALLSYNVFFGASRAEQLAEDAPFDAVADHEIGGSDPLSGSAPLVPAGMRPSD